MADDALRRRKITPDATDKSDPDPAPGSTGSNNAMTTWYYRYEVPRKTLHSSIGVVTMVLYRYGATGPAIIRTISPCLVIIVSADLLRFNSPSFAKTYERVLGPMMRTSEREGRWNGVIFFMLGVVSVLYFFPDDIGALSICLLSWCDTAASILGRMYGPYGPQLRKGKSLIGTLAAVAMGTATTFLFFNSVAPYRPEQASWTSSSSLSLGALSLLGGVVASFSEFVDIWGVDDNLVIPVVSGGLLWTVLCGLGLGRN